MWWQSPGDTLIKVTCLSGLHRGCLGSRRPWVSRQQSPTLDDVTPHKHTHRHMWTDNTTTADCERLRLFV